MAIFWYIDFEGYQLAPDDYIVKEISILKSDGSACFTYLVNSPKNYAYRPENNQTMQYQFNRHKLGWNFGDFMFRDVMADIRAKVEDKMVFCKGLEKCKFLFNYMWRVSDLPMIPSFKTLKNCSTDWCNYRHGAQCAQRKVYELRHYVETNNITLN